MKTLKKKTGTMAILSLLLMSMTFVSVRAFGITGTIYIRADGSIDPSTAPIQRNGDTYTLTDNISQSDIYATTIVIERDNIVFDGAGYTLNGLGVGTETAIELSGRQKVTIKNVEVRNFNDGIYLTEGSSKNTIDGNKIIGGGTGIRIVYSSNNNNILRNNITNSGSGIYLFRSSFNNISENYIAYHSIGIFIQSDTTDNLVYHNSFISNTIQASTELIGTNVWDDGYPSGGNYWSDYTGTDSDGDGIGDTPYVIDANNLDRYPLIVPWGAIRYDWPMFRYDPKHTGYSLSSGPKTNNTMWSYTTGKWIHSSPAVAYGRVYVGSIDSNVYCLGASTGNLIWSYTTGSGVWDSPAIADGKVYVGSLNSNVYCLDAIAGTFIWSYTTGKEVYSSPAIADGKVYVGSADNNVYCLDASTGAFIWSYRTEEWIRSSPAVADGKVYIGSDDSNVYCLDASTGNLIWSYRTGSLVTSSPAIADGRVYVGSYGSNVYCLDASTGAFIWSYRTEGGVYVESSPAVADGKVYIGSDDSNVYCLDASTGNLIWSYTTGSWVSSSPAVADGKVYIGSGDSNVYAFGPEIHDIAVTNVSTSKTVVGQGYNTAINVTAENQGIETETFNVTVYYGNGTFTSEQWNLFWSKGDVNRDGYVNMIDVDTVTASFGSTPGNPRWNPDADINSDGKVDMKDVGTCAKSAGYNYNIWKYFLPAIGTQTIENLTDGDSAALTFTWDTTGLTYGNYSITAVAYPVTNETNTADNNFTIWAVVTIPGDIGGDFKVGLYDLTLLAWAYGSRPGDPNWNPDADIDGNGVVGLSDLVILAQNYGRQSP